VHFGSFSYRGSAVNGKCQDWTSFGAKELVLPLDNMYFGSIEVTLESQDIFTLDTHVNKTLVCTDRTAVSSLAYLLYAGRAGNMTCNSQTWRVLTCSSVPSLCVNCEDRCPASSSCGLSESTLLNPCFTCDAPRTSAYFIATFRYATDIVYPQLVINSTTATKNSITVHLNVSAGGRIYCAGFLGNPSITAVSSIRQVASVLTVTSAGLHSLDISGLVPSSSYAVRCYSEDFKNHIMPISAVSSVSVDTLCCRSITFSQFTVKLTEQVVSSVNTLTLDSLPSASTTVSLVWNSKSCSSQVAGMSPSLTVSPSSFLFSSVSKFSYGTFVMKGNPGCYDVTANISSGSYYNSVTSAIVVNSAAAAPSPPVLASATFSDDGRKLLINFDTTTDSGATTIVGYTGSFKCSLCLEFPGAAYVQCLWISGSQISAQLSGNSTAASGIVTGSSVTLLANRIKTGSCPSDVQCKYANSSVVIVAAPSNPVSPTVSLSVSATFRTCDNIVMDPSGTVGQAGRDWASVSWTVSASNVVNVSIVARIQSLLSADYTGGTSSLVTIPSSYLGAGTYTFMLRVTNFLGRSGTALVTTTVVAQDDLFSVSIAGPSTVLMYRWQTLNLFAVANAQTCSKSVTSLTYTWSVYKDLKYQSLSSESKDARFFKLSAYQLDASTNYVIKGSVSGSGTTSLTTATVVVQVGQSGTFAVISGGASRTLSAENSIFLDASCSYDIDYQRTKSRYFGMECK
jgi:hypothetical protein